MEHPFVGNLDDKTIEELAETISKLYKNLAFASRNGRYDMANQIQMALDSYRTVLDRKQRELFDDTSSTIQGKIDITWSKIDWLIQ